VGGVKYTTGLNMLWYIEGAAVTHIILVTFIGTVLLFGTQHSLYTSLNTFIFNNSLFQATCMGATVSYNMYVLSFTL